MSLLDPLGGVVGGLFGIQMPDPIGDALGLNGGDKGGGGGGGGVGGLLGGILGGDKGGGLLGGLLGGGGGAGGLLGGVLGGGDPLSGIIGAAGDALGLPKELTGALKVGAGFFSGDVMCAISGGAEFLSSAAHDMSTQARCSFDRPSSCVQGYGTGHRPHLDPMGMHEHPFGKPVHVGVPVVRHRPLPPPHCHPEPPPTHCHPQPPPGHVGGYVPPTSYDGPGAVGGTGPNSGLQEQYTQLKTLEENFDQIDMRYLGPLFGHDGHIDMDDLQHLSASPNCPPDVKRAVRYLMENPALYHKLAQSGGAITRSDIEMAMDDTQKALGGPAGQGVSGTTNGGGTESGSDVGGVSGSDSGSGSSSGAQETGGVGGQISDILNNPSMSIEEKIEQVLTLIEQQLDDQMGDVMQQMADNQNKSAGAQGNDKKGAESAQNNQEQLQFKLQQLVEKRKAMFDLLSNVESKFSEMSSLAIQNLGKA